MRFNKKWFILTLVALMMVFALAACGGSEETAPVEEAAPTTAPAEEAVPVEEVSGDKIKIGLSFSDFATERWKNEEILMRGLLEEMGYEVLSQEANHDVK
ncbi:MAG: hypothetical protein IAF02_15480, partial [Anaerolineae bacterium]|nr:hypothetical protein [Anaerolineae bacterium]